MIASCSAFFSFVLASSMSRTSFMLRAEETNRQHGSLWRVKECDGKRC